MTVAVRGPTLPQRMLGAALLFSLMAGSGMVSIVIAGLAASLLRGHPQRDAPDTRSPPNES